MSLAEVPSYIPDTPFDIKPVLTLVPELKDENPGQMGSMLFHRAFDIHHLSKTVMAADIAKLATVKAKNPDLYENREPNFHPAKLGAAFLGTPTLVREVVARYTGQFSKVPGANEAEIRAIASSVFSLAERMLDVPPEILDLIIKKYNHESDREGIMAGETEVKRLALLAIHGLVEKPEQPNVPEPPKGRFGLQDDLEKDLYTPFHEQPEVPELPVSGLVFKAEKELVLA